MARRRTRRGGLVQRIGETSTPVFLLDHRRRVVYFNSGCEQLTGWSADDVITVVCDYVGECDAAGAAALAGALCPPPEVLEGHAAAVPVHLPRREGRPFDRVIQFIPLKDRDERVESVLGLILPVDPHRPAAAPTLAQRLHAELAAMRTSLRQRFGPTTLVTKSAAMRRVCEQVCVAGGTTTPVTLIGEPGAGKEHVARVIHHASTAAARAFVPIDCQATPAVDVKLTLRRLMAAEAEAAAEGTPPSVRPGTLYLQHVERLPRDAQQLLLEALDGEESGRGRPVRLIAATQAGFDQALADESLQDEFFFLLTPLRIELPPLRRRRDDLPLLAQSFLEEFNRGSERQVGGFQEAVLREFERYDWPGNLDELAAVIEESRAAAVGAVIAVEDLPFRFRAGRSAQTVGPRWEAPAEPLTDYLDRVERDRILAVLTQVRHNKAKAAELLGLTRPRLYRRMEALGIEDRNQAG